MSQAPLWLDTLTEVAKQQGIELPLAQAKSFQNEDSSELEFWVQDNLSGQICLTSEELAIWQVIEKKKKKRPAYHQRDGLAQVADLPLTDEALKDAINTLESSTQMLDVKTFTLENQRQLLDNSLQQFRSHQPLDHPAEKRQHGETQRIFFTSRDAESRLSETLSISQMKVNKLVGKVRVLIQDKLRADDRMLDALDTVSHKPLHDVTSQTRAQSIVTALQHSIVLGLKARLDRLYLQELQTRYNTENSNTSHDAMSEAQSDIQSLYSEIEVVASMLVEHEFGTQLTVLEKQIKCQIEQEESRNAGRIIDRLEKLTTLAEDDARSFQRLHGHRMVLLEVNKLLAQNGAQDEMWSATISDANQQDESNNTGTEALLRHLGIATGSGLRETSTLPNLHQLATTMAAGSRDLSIHTSQNLLHSTHLSRDRLQSIVANLRPGLSEAARQNLQLDKQIALAKARLERR